MTSRLDKQLRGFQAMIVSTALAIRDSNEKITYSLLNDVCEVVLFNYIYDGRELPHSAGPYEKVNPESKLLRYGIKTLEEKKILQRKSSNDTGKRLSYNIHENMNQNALLYDHEYKDALDIIKRYKLKHGEYKWKYELSEDIKKLYRKGDIIYEFTKSNKAITHIKNVLLGTLQLTAFNGLAKIILDWTEGKINETKIKSLEESPNLDQYTEDFIDEKSKTSKTGTILTLPPGLCVKIEKSASITDGKIDIIIYYWYKAIRIRAYSDAFNKDVDLDKLTDHSLQIIGMLSRENTGEIMIEALRIIDKGKKYRLWNF